MSTATTPSNREHRADGLARAVERASSSLKRAGRALSGRLDAGAPPGVKRDAMARKVIRVSVFALEVVAVAFLLLGALGVVQQFGAADPLDPTVWLSASAIAVVAGLGALFSLAVAAALLTLLRLRKDVEAMRSRLELADRQRPLAGDAGDGTAAAA